MYFKVGCIMHCYILFNLKAAFFIRLFANIYQLKKAALIWKVYSKVISLFLESKPHKCCTSVRFLLHRISKYFSVYILVLVPSLMKILFLLTCISVRFLKPKSTKITSLCLKERILFLILWLNVHCYSQLNIPIDKV